MTKDEARRIVGPLRHRMQLRLAPWERFDAVMQLASTRPDARRGQERIKFLHDAYADLHVARYAASR